MVAAVTESRSSACGQLFAEDFPTDLQRLGAELLHFLQTKSGALALAALGKRGLNPYARPFVPSVPADQKDKKMKKVNINLRKPHPCIWADISGVYYDSTKGGV